MHQSKAVEAWRILVGMVVYIDPGVFGELTRDQLQLFISMFSRDGLSQPGSGLAFLKILRVVT